MRVIEKLTRYEIGLIQQMHDEQQYRCVDQAYLTQQLNRIGLPEKVSRFELAQKVIELEKDII